MLFNVCKCKVLHVGKKNSKVEYSLMGQKIPVSNEEKDLGVYFDESFKSNCNCNRVSKAVSKVVWMIERNISNKSSEGMLILYKSL